MAEKTPEVERRRFYVVSADIEAHGHMGSCPGYALLASQGKSDKTTERMNSESESERLLKKTLTGEARIDTCRGQVR